MQDLFVGQLMSAPVKTVTTGTTLRETARLMQEEAIGSVVVVDEDNQLSGIVTTTDFCAVVADGQDSGETPVDEYMTTDVVTTTADLSIRDLADDMIEGGFHHMPVVEEDEGVIGIVTTTDLTAYLSHVKKPSPKAD